MKINKMLVAAMIAVTVSGTAQAQATINCGGSGETAIGTLASPGTCAVTNDLTAAVAPVARLNITTSATTLLAPLAADFGVGGNGTQVITAGPTLNVSANVPHTLTASAPTTWLKNLAASTKPSSDLQIQINGAGGYAAIGTIGTSGAATDATPYALSFGNKYNWTVDTPGSYSLLLTFTLTSP